jgi:hypothetical protein
VRRGLDHAAEQAPAYVRVRPEAGRRHGGGDIRREPRERAVVLVLVAGEAELQPGAQRKPGAIRKKVARGRAFGPAPRSSGTCATTGSSNDKRPSSARRAITVATIDLVKDPTLKRVSGVIGSPLVTSATP